MAGGFFHATPDRMCGLDRTIGVRSAVYREPIATEEPLLELALVPGSPRRFHVVAAGGSAMNGIARLLREMGHEVTGSDAVASPVLDRLAADGVEVWAGSRPDRVAGASAVVLSTAVPDDDPEVVAARAAGIPVLRRPAFMASLCRLRRVVGVAGAHGKTTTTAMLATALRSAGRDVGFLVGGEVPGLGSARWGSDEWFVVEADESDGSFLQLGAEAVVVTNIEPDHLDHWGSFDALGDGYRRFVEAATGPRLLCADDAGTAALAASLDGVLTYGTGEGADLRLDHVRTDRTTVVFELDGRELRVTPPGTHNARNAAAAFAMAVALGADPDGVAEGLATFRGVGRRFELRGEAGGVTFVDSYDHLPSEVASVLATAKAGGWDRIVCVFQPHRYTRIRDLWQDFADAFVDADVLAVTEIYRPVGAPVVEGVRGKLIVDAVLDAHPRSRVAWLPARDGLRAWLRSELRPGDLCLTLGAGDLTTLPDDLLQDLS
jgi:UDP-N-acetylmuramate--alanine ligase